MVIGIYKKIILENLQASSLKQLSLASIIGSISASSEFGINWYGIWLLRKEKNKNDR